MAPISAAERSGSWEEEREWFNEGGLIGPMEVDMDTRGVAVPFAMPSALGEIVGRSGKVGKWAENGSVWSDFSVESKTA